MSGLRWVCLWTLLLGLAIDAAAGTPRVVKVLPHYLDKQGRHSLVPSLFERDAYQATLRKDPSLRSGLRFDIQWRSGGVATDGITVRVELRTSKKYESTPLVKEQPLRRKGWIGRWTEVTIDGDTFKEMGDMIAWRVTFWRDGQQIAEQKSFLW